MTAGTWSDGVDPNTPSPARMYDYYLGGDHNFAADREAAEQVIAAVPNAREIARANRAFLGNAVRYLLDQGIRQFLDIGSGIPTVGNVHEIVADTQPAARVVYVDVDPIAVAHSVSLLQGNPNATAIRADLRYPEAILTHHNVRTLLDFSQPLALLTISMLQFVADDDAYPAIEKFREVLAPGSYVAISHVVTGALADENTGAVAQIYRRSTTPTGVIRSRPQILAFADGLELVPPGLTWVSQWQPGASATSTIDDHTIAIAGLVARKP